MTERRFEPREKFRKCRAILLHRMANVMRFASVLRLFASVDGLMASMICTAGGTVSLQAERDTARIDQQLRIGRQRLQRGGSALVGRQRNAVSSQARCKLCIDLAFSNEQRGAFCVEQQMRNEHRVVTDIAATQVGEPRDVVERRNPMMRGAELFHLLAHGGELVGARQLPQTALSVRTGCAGNAARSSHTSLSTSRSVRSSMPRSLSADCSARAPDNPSTAPSTATSSPPRDVFASQSRCAELPAPPIFISSMPVPANCPSACAQ